ncbi:MAG: hypothetical protein FJ297_10975 [Planctomycetes bacterium]|nr:hypothetical protein [Planctomycetota bacterium]
MYRKRGPFSRKPTWKARIETLWRQHRASVAAGVIAAAVAGPFANIASGPFAFAEPLRDVPRVLSHDAATRLPVETAAPSSVQRHTPRLWDDEKPTRTAGSTHADPNSRAHQGQARVREPARVPDRRPSTFRGFHLRSDQEQEPNHDRAPAELPLLPNVITEIPTAAEVESRDTFADDRPAIPAPTVNATATAECVSDGLSGNAIALAIFFGDAREREWAVELTSGTLSDEEIRKQRHILSALGWLPRESGLTDTHATARNTAPTDQDQDQNQNQYQNQNQEPSSTSPYSDAGAEPTDAVATSAPAGTSPDGEPTAASDSADSLDKPIQLRQPPRVLDQFAHMNTPIAPQHTPTSSDGSIGTGVLRVSGEPTPAEAPVDPTGLQKPLGDVSGLASNPVTTPGAAGPNLVSPSLPTIGSTMGSTSDSTSRSMSDSNTEGTTITMSMSLSDTESRSPERQPAGARPKPTRVAVTAAHVGGPQPTLAPIVSGTPSETPGNPSKATSADGPEPTPASVHSNGPGQEIGEDTFAIDRALGAFDRAKQSVTTSLSQRPIPTAVLPGTSLSSHPESANSRTARTSIAPRSLATQPVAAPRDPRGPSSVPAVVPDMQIVVDAGRTNTLVQSNLSEPSDRWMFDPTNAAAQANPAQANPAQANPAQATEVAIGTPSVPERAAVNGAVADAVRESSPNSPTHAKPADAGQANVGAIQPSSERPIQTAQASPSTVRADAVRGPSEPRRETVAVASIPIPSRGSKGLGGTPGSESPSSRSADVVPAGSTSESPASSGTDPAPSRPVAEPLITHRKLDLGVRQSMSVRSEFEIARAESVDPTICDAVQFSPFELTLIGKRDGQTHVRVWFKNQDQDQSTGGEQQEKPSGAAPAPSREASTNYLIAVKSPEDQARVADREYDKLLASIRSLHPDARVELISSGDRLVVQGTVSSEDEAIQILSLVRKVRLIPVVDRLRVTGR